MAIELQTKLRNYQNPREVSDYLSYFNDYGMNITLSPKVERSLMQNRLFITEKLSIKRGFGSNVTYNKNDLNIQNLRKERERARRQYRYHLKRKGEDNDIVLSKLKSFQEKTVQLFERVNQPYQERFYKQLRELRAQSYAEKLREERGLLSSHDEGEPWSENILTKVKNSIVVENIVDGVKAIKELLPSWNRWKRAYQGVAAMGAITLGLHGGGVDLISASKSGLDLSSSMLEKNFNRYNFFASSDINYVVDIQNWDQASNRVAKINTLINHFAQQNNGNLTNEQKIKISELYQIEDDEEFNRVLQEDLK